MSKPSRGPGPFPPPPEDEATAEETTLSIFPENPSTAWQCRDDSPRATCDGWLPTLEQCPTTYWRAASDNPHYSQGAFTGLDVVDETGNSTASLVGVVESLLHGAWEFMYSNWDLVEWALCNYSDLQSDQSYKFNTCVVAGFPSMMECVKAAFAQGVTVALVDNATSGGSNPCQTALSAGLNVYGFWGDKTGVGGAAAVGLENGRINLCIDYESWTLMAGLARNPWAAASVCSSDGSANLFDCLFIEIGVMLIHEILHGCGSAHGEKNEHGWECSGTPASATGVGRCAMNSLRYALAKRYEPLSICCKYFAEAANATGGHSFYHGPCGQTLRSTPNPSVRSNCCDPQFTGWVLTETIDSFSL